jgi:hypothetical protein
MLTGIETAALVLGIFPLLVAALEHYKAGLEPLKTFSHYELRLIELKGELAFHRGKFLQSLTLLLERCVQPKALGALLSDPLGGQWKDQDLEARLSKCLGSFDFSVFIDVVTGFKSTLEELFTKLDVDQHGKVQLHLLLIETQRLIPYSQSGPTKTLSNEHLIESGTHFWTVTE